MVWHWMLHVGGIDDVSSNWYGFWSGFAADIPLLIGIALFGWHHQCHQDGCYRISSHRITDEQGVTKPACRKHR